MDASAVTAVGVLDFTYASTIRVTGAELVGWCKLTPPD
jgi:hypothetical protein